MKQKNCLSIYNFNIDLKIANIFENPTIKELATLFSNENNSNIIAKIEKAEKLAKRAAQSTVAQGVKADDKAHDAAQALIKARKMAKAEGDEKTVEKVKEVVSQPENEKIPFVTVNGNIVFTIDNLKTVLHREC